ncbi:MAG: PA0069 family radical SAM protein [Deltaproteobacteria bacterium]|nr:PA0069 family radical SAM protein [Deltaproteobacteria bacterium]
MTSHPRPTETIRGRGTSENPANRFEPLHYDVEPDDETGWHPDDPDDAARAERTQYLRDPSRRILARNDSPDVPFGVSINPYRGCEHGCIYCYARPTHEYLGFSAGLDFETRILVKQDAPELLRRELASPRWKPQLLGLSGVTDPYQPIERNTRLTRRCLEVLLEFRNPVGIVTKNALVTRDIDLLEQLAGHRAVSVHVSVTTLDPALHRVMEPRTSSPAQRLRTIERLAHARVPVGVMVAPVIPGLTDHEIPKILEAAAAAGARRAGFLLLRLPHGVAPLFDDWLKRHYPARSRKVLARIRELRGGRLNDPRFGSRMGGEGIYAQQIDQLFRISARRAGLDGERRALSTEAFRRPAKPQLELFE